MTILFVQGAGKGAHDDWDNKLVASLARELATKVLYPRMPDEEHPQHAAWKSVLVHELDQLPPGAILVGHSVGGTTLLHALAEQHSRVKPAAIISISSPFIGDGGWPSDDVTPRYDFGERLPDVPIHLFHGTADPFVPLAHVECYAKTMPRAVVHTLPDRDHQLNNDLSEVARAIAEST